MLFNHLDNPTNGASASRLLNTAVDTGARDTKGAEGIEALCVLDDLEGRIGFALFEDVLGVVDLASEG
jgi:hypothetical protein